MYKTDILIIGAGVIGLAVAEELSALSKSIIVVEKNESFGRETSSRNSEVIHGGIYYPHDSLKTRMCVKGRELLYEFCEKNNIAHKKTGKLIVATEKEEIGAIESLFSNACKNGVPGLKIMDREEIKKMEPDIFGITALHSPETGIVDSHSLMQRLIGKAKANGVTMAYNSEVMAIEKDKDIYNVKVRDANETTTLAARVVINCAGLDSDTIAEMVGIDIRECKYELQYCKGQYFRVNQRKAGRVKRLIYPVPHPKAGGLGIHATPDLGGGLRLGPDHEYLKNRIKDYSVDESRKKEFCASVKRFMPSIEEGDIFTDTAGIRPKLRDYGSDFSDFIIKEETASGFPGLINLIGIESPGLTASLAIAEHVRQIAFPA
ncbi:MAG: NAD(P)/FAD-dependent oxidoreductase [Candidatus Omnitrophica bacterium]|nr:NAD(P)/FAD-dependent oxidoreductase [Candidatus Omnitrophota bacterium]MBU1808656.1 NAD(P)/FAD-dependent oxidoreductase [Candidatus Omnitrophota bacterium]